MKYSKALGLGACLAMSVATVIAASIARKVAPKINSVRPATAVPLIVLITRARKLRLAEKLPVFLNVAATSQTVRLEQF